MKISNSRISPSVLTLLLAVLSTIVAFSIDIYLPLIPSLQKSLHASAAAVQLSLTLFFLAFAVSQLFLGVLADFFGKRKILLIGLCVYAIGSLSCAMASSVNIFILARIIQSIGACSVLLVTFSIIRDVFNGQDSLRAYAYVTMSIAFAPAIAPPIGSYISHFFSWRAVFLFLLILSIILLIVCLRYLPETAGRSTKKFRWIAFVTNYQVVLKEKAFRVYVVCSVMTMSTLMAFVTGSPFLFMRAMGVSSRHFAWYFAFNALILIISGYIAIRLTKKITSKTLVQLGTYCLFIAALIMLFIPPTSPWKFLIPMILVSFAIAVLMPSTMSGLMEPFESLTASAASLTGFLRYVAAGIVSIITVLLASHIVIVIPVIFLACSLVLFITIRRINNQ